MTEVKLPADWALEEAVKRARQVCSYVNNTVESIKKTPTIHSSVSSVSSESSLIILFAQMIEKHEEKPVDPDVQLVFDRYCKAFTLTPTIKSVEGQSWFLAMVQMVKDVRAGKA